eukprot:CAMPEP_0118932158 /NCGR_PEP_ID=MMETSP1169-20130426/9288_1 /TAXON_ID=36882 /ORGANISM="Pyramimonas obovata, Strain CCMP722" /LENGTH=210 /DNA_ID=CAMNT_0006874773 /DNA_START=196 /DNA_END=825 /DNA_ORIENTATION=+
MPEAGETGFCTEAWERSTDIRSAIYNMPFVQMLSDGTLPMEIFQHYMLQDSCYLGQYARALSTAASKATTQEDQIFLSKASAKAVEVEGALHQGFLAKFGVEETEKGCPSPTNAGYVNYLLATAHTKPFEVLCAALLPCFWLYMDVGLRIVEQSAPNNAYQSWIDLYAGDEFGDGVRKMQALCNRLAESTSPLIKEEMLKAYMHAARFEW